MKFQFGISSFIRGIGKVKRTRFHVLSLFDTRRRIEQLLLLDDNKNTILKAQIC